MKHRVQPGECIESIAFDHGHLWRTIWESEDNRALRELRKDPNVLQPGDEVVIPPIRPKVEHCATGKRHIFMRRGVPFVLCLEFQVKGKPRAHVPYTLTIDGKVTQGETDANGRMQAKLPPRAKHCSLVVGVGDEARTYRLRDGHLDPNTKSTGLRSRLANLGFFCGDEEDEEETRAALSDFQQSVGLPVTGEADASTLEKLHRQHGR